MTEKVRVRARPGRLATAVTGALVLGAALGCATAANGVTTPDRGAVSALQPSSQVAGPTSSPAATTTSPATRAAPTAAADNVGGAPWGRAIPATPALDPKSAAMIRTVVAEGIAANLDEFSTPIYTTGAGTKTYAVECTKPWGRCDLEQQRIPIPSGARPSSGSDGAMVVLDPNHGVAYDFWQARRTTGGWAASWGTRAALGRVSDDGATGAGLFLLWGVVRTAEIQARSIPHALTFSTANACSRGFRYPAIKTDGVSSRSDCLPLGARLQLDPKVDVDALPGITPGERAVAKALQRYGAYARDTGAEGLAFAFQRGGSDGVYTAAGLPWDYYDMPHIPWSKLRVLRAWDGR